VPIAALFAISLLAGIALGLYANVRGLIAALAVVAVAVFAAILYAGDPIGWSLLQTVAVVVVVQVGYFVALLVRTVSGFDKAALDAARGVDPVDGSTNPATATEDRPQIEPANVTTEARDHAPTRTDVD
jgi:hypothetical protein